MKIPALHLPRPSPAQRALWPAAALLVLLAACSKGPSEAEQIAAAKASLAKQDGKAAVIQLKNAIQSNPKSAEARFLLGKLLLAGGDANTAVVELTKAQELQVPDEQVIPEIARALLGVGDEKKLVAQYGNTTLKDDTANADLHNSVGTAMAVNGDLEGARKMVALALKDKPGYPPAQLTQARLIAAGGDLDGALAQLDQILAADASNEAAGVLKGEYLLMGKRDAAAALAAYRKVLEGHAKSVAARSAAANILLLQQKVPEARAEFDQLKKTAPEHPETLLVEARLAFADKDLKRTGEITDRLLKGMPNSVNVLELAGAAELSGRKYLQAEAHLGQALKLAPQLLRPRLLLAQSHLGSGQPEKALQVLQPILDGKAPDATSLSLAGEAYMQLGDNKRSEAAMKQALKVAPGSPAVRTTAAIAQVARGEGTAAALTELETAASGDKSSRADLALISARMAQNDTAGALKAIDALEKKQADKRLPRLLRGRVLMMRKDYDGARRSLDAALAEDATYFPAVAALGAVDLAEGKPEQTRKRFETFLAANPKNFRAKLALAELEIRTGGPSAKVVALLRDAVKLDPTEMTPHLLLIARLGNNGDAKGALVAAQDAAAALPDNLDVQEALGMAQVAAGDAQVAVSTLKKLTALQPRKASYLLRLAEAHRANKDDASARLTLKQALELDPDLNPARSALIGLALQDKRPDDALTLAREAQQRKPKDAIGFLLEGEIEASRKNWDAAATALRAALQRNRNGSTVVKLHAALMAGGKAAEADRVAADWTKDNPKDAVFAFYLGDLAMARNDLPGAEARYRSVLETQPLNALAMNNVAWLLTRQGKPGGVAMAEKANDILPDRAPLLDTWSLTLENEQQLPKAIEVQARAVKLQPNDPNLSMRLAKLYIKSGDKGKAKTELESLVKLGSKFGEHAEVEKLLKTL